MLVERIIKTESVVLQRLNASERRTKTWVRAKKYNKL